MAAGSYQLAEVRGQGYKPIVAWCSYGDNISYTKIAPYAAQPLNLYLAAGKSVECGWFSVPYVEPAHLDITIRVCPADFPMVDVTNEKILAGCATLPTGVNVTVQSASTPGADSPSDPYSATLPTDLDGRVFFDSLPPTPLRISELGTHLQTVAVNCGSAAIGESPASYISLTITGDGIDYKAESNTDISCYWALKQLPPADVAIWVSTCLPDYEFAVADLEYLTVNCTPKEGVDFTVTSQSANYDKTVASSVAGLATFEEVPPDVLTMTEGAADQRVVRIFCGTATSGFTNQEFLDDATEYLTKGENVTCYWFTIDTTYATVTIHKYACEEGYLPQGHTYQDVLQECPAPQKGVTFTLGGPATELNKVTDASGNVSWEDVAPGALFIGETPPHGYTDAVVFCAVYYEEALFERVPVEHFSIQQEVKMGDTLECYWFNVKKAAHPDTPSPTPTPGTGQPNTPTPAPETDKSGTPTPTPNPDAPATLVLTTYLCPENFDVYAADADLAVDCEETTPGIEVSLANLEEASAPIVPVESATTNGDGVATFSGLEPGLWLLTESLPEATSTAFIASCTSDQRDLEAEPLFTPLTYLGPGGEIGLVLIPGETLACTSNAIPEEVDAA